MVELLVALVDQVAVVGAQLLVLQRAADDDQEFVDLERFLQVVEGAEFHRLERALHCGMRRHHQDLWSLAFGRGRDELANQVEAVQLRHHVVDDEHVERTLGEQPLRVPRAGGFHDDVAGVAQRTTERLQNLFFIVDQEDGTAVCHDGGLP